MSLHGRPLEEAATLPDGREVHVRVGVARDPYVAERDLDTVDVEVFADDAVLATVNTVLDANDDEAARGLLQELVARLASGELEPTAAAIEPLADRGR